MELTEIEAKMAEAELTAGVAAKDADGPHRAEFRRLERLGWDELTIEQKVERMRAIVKGIDHNVHEHWRRLEELGQQMRLHVH